MRARDWLWLWVGMGIGIAWLGFLYWVATGFGVHLCR